MDKNLNGRLDQNPEKFAIGLNKMKEDIKNTPINKEKLNMQMGAMEANLLLLDLKE